jgi:hypothetical protein
MLISAPMRAALAQVREPESLDLRVTPERVVVGALRATSVERKVKLPMRWLKGFAEVQALATTLVHAATLRWAGSAPVSIGHPTRSEGPRSGLAAARNRRPARQPTGEHECDRLSRPRPLTSDETARSPCRELAHLRGGAWDERL